MSLRDRVKSEAANGGFRRHPIGTFDATVDSINEKEHEGRTLWEVHIVSGSGKAKVTIWKNTLAEIRNADDEEKYIKSMGRLCRLYTDLGLPEPDGQTDEELENNIYGRLGELLGRACTLVVQADKRNQGEVICFLNAPKGGSTAVTASAASAFDGQPLPAGQIPF